MATLKPCPSCRATKLCGPTTVLQWVNCGNCGTRGPDIDPTGALWNALPRREDRPAVPPKVYPPCVWFDGVGCTHPFVVRQSPCPHARAPTPWQHAPVCACYREKAAPPAVTLEQAVLAHLRLECHGHDLPEAECERLVAIERRFIEQEGEK